MFVVKIITKIYYIILKNIMNLKKQHPTPLFITILNIL